VPADQAAWLGGCFAEVLQDAAFVFAAPAEDAPEFEGAVVEASLRWTGGEPGAVLLAVSPAFAAELAANLLGEDEPRAGQAEDAVGELLNMAAGTLLRERFGPRAGCWLEPPRVRSISPEEHAARVAAAAVRATLVDDGGNRVDVALLAGDAP
jgi:hypothetical protein